MRISLEKLNGTSRITVSDLDDNEAAIFAADPEVLVPGMQPEGSLYRRVFPEETPYLELATENLRRSHQEILAQASGATSPDWMTAIDYVLDRLAETEIKWIFIGGIALVAQGVEIVPGDVDIITDVAGAKAMNDLFRDTLIAPAAPIPGWGYFGRSYKGAKAEWAGNDPDQNPQIWNLSAPQKVVKWRGHKVRVALLETYLRIERERGRSDRVAAIEAVLPRKSESDS